MLDQMSRRNSLSAPPPEGETKAEMLARRRAALDDGTAPETLCTKTRPKRESVLLDKKNRASSAPDRCSLGAAATVAESGTTQPRASSVQTLRSRVHRLSLLVRKLPAPTEDTLNAQSEGRPGDVGHQTGGWDSACLPTANAAAPSAAPPARTPEMVCMSSATLDALEQSHAQNVDLSGALSV
tara:strand:+ start:4332 stop:4880 length:549 start_codon:yes stop_codon:yes gene_type:complete